MVTLNRIVAVAMVRGPSRALAELNAAADDRRWPATTGSTPSARTCSTSWGDHEQARRHYGLAARRTLSLPEQQYLRARARRT